MHPDLQKSKVVKRFNNWEVLLHVDGGYCFQIDPHKYFFFLSCRICKVLRILLGPEPVANLFFS